MPISTKSECPAPWADMLALGQTDPQSCDPIANWLNYDNATLLYWKM